MDRRLPWLLVAGVTLLFGLSTCSSHRALEASNAELDSIRGEETRLKLEAADWSTRFAIEVEHGESLEQIVAAQDQQLRILGPATDSLIRQVELLGGQVRTLTSMYVGAVGQIEAHGTVHVESSGGIDSVTADVDDGLLAAHLFYRAPDVLGLDPYHVTIPLVSTVSELADGRSLVTARAADQRVTIEFGEVYVQRPEPVAYCGIGTRAKWGAGGAAVGGIGGTLLGLWLGGLP